MPRRPRPKPSTGLITTFTAMRTLRRRDPRVSSKPVGRCVFEMKTACLFPTKTFHKATATESLVVLYGDCPCTIGSFCFSGGIFAVQVEAVTSRDRQRRRGGWILVSAKLTKSFVPKEGVCWRDSHVVNRDVLRSRGVGKCVLRARFRNLLVLYVVRSESRLRLNKWHLSETSLG